MINSFILLVLLVIVSVISFTSLRWIEVPFRNKYWFIKENKMRTMALLLGMAGLLMKSPSLNAVIEKPLPAKYTRYADPNLICHGRVVGSCLRGAKDANAKFVLVLGDSHAAQLNLFFDRMGEIGGTQFRVISASSCVTIPGFDVERLPLWAQKDCRSSIEYAARFIPDSSSIVIAAMWQYQLQSKEFIFALKEFLSQTQVAKKQVTLLWQVPMLDANIQRVRRFEALGIRSGSSIHEEWSRSNMLVSEIAGQYSNVRFLEFSSEEMFKSPPFYRGELMYHDGHHLNELGAAKYGYVASSKFYR
jgi:hypothetical protein